MLFVFAPAAICVYCNGTNHSLSAPIVSLCVRLHADCVMMHMYTVALFVHISILFQHWQLPHYHFPCFCPQKEVWMCPKLRGASALCLLDTGGPCAPPQCYRTKTVVSPPQKQPLFLLPSLPHCVPHPAFLTLHAGWWMESGCEVEDIAVPLTFGTRSNSAWLCGCCAWFGPREHSAVVWFEHFFFSWGF